MPRKRILILLHSHDRSFERPTSTVRYFRDEWEARGHSVLVACGTKVAVDADVVVNHVDLTLTPPSYRAYMDRYPAAVNRDLVDISKRRVSTNLLGRHDDYDGQVMVKTNANSGGRRDLALDAPTSVAKRIAWRITRSRRPSLSRARFVPESSYPIFDSLRDVPVGVWRNDRLVVEKFLSERDDAGNYLVRSWWFFGDRGFDTLLRSSDPIAKGHAIVERSVTTAPIPSELQAIRTSLHADYGRIDYAIVDGQPVVYDLNRTPITSGDAYASYGDQIAALAHGIDDLCRA